MGNSHFFIIYLKTIPVLLKIVESEYNLFVLIWIVVYYMNSDKEGIWSGGQCGWWKVLQLYCNMSRELEKGGKRSRNLYCSIYGTSPQIRLGSPSPSLRMDHYSFLFVTTYLGKNLLYCLCVSLSLRIEVIRVRFYWFQARLSTRAWEVGW